MSQAPIIPIETAFSIIDCESAFAGLTQKQAQYAYYFAKASWSGTKVCFFERSYESPALLYILLKGFEKTPSKQVFEKAKSDLGEEELNKIFIYLSAFLDNAGNFKSFGDSKFIPECSQENFRKFWLLTEYWSGKKEQFEKIYSRIEKYIFAWEAPYGLIGFINNKGTSGYYSGNITQEDAEAVKTITIKNNLMSENNRLVKIAEKQFIIKVASIVVREEIIEENGIKITIKYGEFQPFMKHVSQYLSEARKYSANEIQQKMLEEYADHFKTGSMERHKDSQRSWIKDKQPAVETNIGFIESYLDPLKVRAEFEGFVAVVNKEQSALLTKLVQSAENNLKKLPWGADFEVQHFKRPDFTSLEVLAFGSSGIPIGINIPNYDDIRQNLGFKNVNLGNAYGQPTTKSILFCPENEMENHVKYFKPSLFLIVALHELLGHGSGRLFHSLPNFKNPIDNSDFSTFYKKGQTWHSVFGSIASTYEECRADSVALFLSTFQEVQQILLPTFSPEERWEVVFVGWFNMINGGLRGMEYFDVASKKWLQAHIGGRFAIFRVLQEEGGVFDVKETERDGKAYLQIHLNRQSIKTKGRAAIGAFLRHLQVYKSTADHEKGTKFFNKYLEMDEQCMKYREVVLKNKKPRRLTVQAQLQLVDGKPQYHMFPADCFGCIDSGVAHFAEDSEDVLTEWEGNNQEFRY